MSCFCNNQVVGKSPVDVEEGKMDKVSAYFGASGSFAHGFIATLSVILVSELGDKTFVIGKCHCHVRYQSYFGDKTFSSWLRPRVNFKNGFAPLRPTFAPCTQLLRSFLLAQMLGAGSKRLAQGAKQFMKSTPGGAPK